MSHEGIDPAALLGILQFDLQVMDGILLVIYLLQQFLIFGHLRGQLLFDKSNLEASFVFQSLLELLKQSQPALLFVDSFLQLRACAFQLRHLIEALRQALISLPLKFQVFLELYEVLAIGIWQFVLVHGLALRPIILIIAL